MKRLVYACLTGAALLLSSAAHADDKTACLDATEQGQRLRASHHLVQARQQFLLCARSACPALVQQECGAWLVDAEKSLPSVVITAKDGKGVDLVDVTVTVDGESLITKLDGEAVPVDPGRHVFHFSTADGRQLDQQTIVKEGEKNQGLAVVLRGRGATGTEGTTSAPATAVAPAKESAWRTVGWVAGGTGVVGIALGAIFGGLAISDNSDAHCNAAKECLAGPLASARAAATVSDVGFIAGGALAAGGLALVLVAPKTTPSAATGALRISPRLGQGSAGLELGGSW